MMSTSIFKVTAPHSQATAPANLLSNWVAKQRPGLRKHVKSYIRPKPTDFVREDLKNKVREQIKYVTEEVVDDDQPRLVRQFNA